MNRQKIAIDESFYLRKKGTQNAEMFTVTGVIGSGSSCICYEAILENEPKIGRLKELYPRDLAVELKRLDDNSLVCESKDFLFRKDDFLNTYEKLRACFNNGNDQNLKDFIPEFSVYESCNENGKALKNGTLYIWTENKNLTNFDEYIKLIHKNHSEKPEQKLCGILNCIIALTKGIEVLHNNAILHLDIKPSNFAIPQFIGEYLTNSIYLFDVNTIHEIGSNADIISCGTPGFSKQSKKVNTSNDIYSIGCVLFAALTGELNGYTAPAKDPQKYISKCINNSKIITATDTTNNIYLKNKLIEILDNCFKNDFPGSSDVYSCTQLVEDLKKARSYLLPAEFSKDYENFDTIKIKKFLDKDNGKTKSELVFLKHLFDYPLYEKVADSSDEINIGIIGFGNYGQRFLDCCLQLGQMKDKKLYATIFSNNKNDKNLYLQDRPEIENFFKIIADNTITGDTSEDNYGTIEFIDAQFTSSESENIPFNVYNEKFDYIFVALGNNELNKSVLNDLATLSENRTSLNGVLSDQEGLDKSVHTISLDKFNFKSADYMALERMAFNSHLVWVQDNNFDYEKEKSKFKEPYNYISNIAYIVSVKYKFYSAGIRLKNITDDAEILAATKEFENKVLNNPDKTLFRQLVAAEHRRWVAEKITKGWTCRKNFSDCIAEHKVNNKDAKEHVCIVKSAADRKIPFNIELFDNVEADLSELDELDKLSVELHRYFNKYLKKKDHIDHKQLNLLLLEIEDIIASNKQAKIYFYDWKTCINLLLNRNKGSVKNYNTCETIFKNYLSTIKSLSAEVQKRLSDNIKNVSNLLFPVIESLRYTDYKAKDEDLITHIPYILNYKHKLNIVVPFSISDVDEFSSDAKLTDTFKNLIVIKLLNPKRICYVCDFRKKQKRKLECFIKALKQINQFFRNKNATTQLSFIILINKDTTETDDLKNELTNLKTLQKTIYIHSEDEIPEAIKSLVGFKTIDAVQSTDFNLPLTVFPDSDIPYFNIDMNTGKINAKNGCEYLNYTKNNAFLTVTELFKLNTSAGVNSSFPEFFENYTKLYDLYKKNSGAWKSVCNKLYDATVNEITIWENYSITSDKATEDIYAPGFCYESLYKIIAFLKKLKKLNNNTNISYQFGGKCKIHFDNTPEITVKQIKGLLANPYQLINTEAVDCYCTSNKKEIRLKIKSMVVENFDCSDLIKHEKECYDPGYIFEFLKDLNKLGLITEIYKPKESNILQPFSFTSQQSGDLLIQAGAVLEMYVYISCINSGLFDDVATGYEVNRNNNETNKNEFDIVLTKGFKSMFVECKATNNLEEVFYNKLSNLKDEFQLNSKAVIVADSILHKDKTASHNNKNMVNYGNKHKIHTVFEKKEINNIAETLYKLLTED